MFRLWILSLGLFLLACYLDSSLPGRKPPLVNDNYSEYFDPLKVLLPQSEQEIVDIVKTAASKQQQVRVLGSGHSRNSLAFSEDVIVSLEGYKGTVHLDRQAQQVTVKGGSTLWEVVHYLDDNGLALGVLPAILEQTIAGAISTGTHGSRTEYGNLATLVTKLKMVTGKGEVITLSAKDENTDMFNAALVSLGLLGIITEVTLQCEPSFRLEETLDMTSLDACLPALREISRSAEHVKAWLEVYSGSCDIYRFQRTEREVEMDTLMWRNLKIHLWEPFLWLSSWFPSLAPALISNSVRCGDIFGPEYSQVGKSFEVLTYPLYVPRNKQAEFSVDVRHCVTALRVVEEEIKKWKIASIFIEVRFVSPDKIWLSMNYQRESCHITILNYNPSEQAKRDFFDSIHHRLADLSLQPRLHFGKYCNVTSQDLEGSFPKYAGFKQLRARLDPQGVFRNSMLAGIF